MDSGCCDEGGCSVVVCDGERDDLVLVVLLPVIVVVTCVSAQAYGGCGKGDSNVAEWMGDKQMTPLITTVARTFFTTWDNDFMYSSCSIDRVSGLSVLVAARPNKHGR
jgi:hypothetical protein